MVVGGTAAVAVGCGDRAEVNREQTLDGKFDAKDERGALKEPRCSSDASAYGPCTKEEEIGGNKRQKRRRRRGGGNGWSVGRGPLCDIPTPPAGSAIINMQ